jgi:hypothetical protein
MVRRYVQYKWPWAYYIDFIRWLKVCVLYEGFGSNGFVTKVQPFPMVGHYRIDVISSVGYLRLDSVV